jgi:transposase-like protein
MAGLLAPQYRDEDAARDYIEKALWPNGPVCPHCGIIGEATKLEPKQNTETHARPGTYKCRACEKQFTATVGTIFEDSHIPLHKWLLGIHLMCSSKKGISAHQLWRNLWGVDKATKKQTGSYRTAWFMAHRIRWALGQEPMKTMLRGVVEADEVYIGGREPGKRGTPGPDSKKTPVVALVERHGDVRSFPVERVTVENIKPILKEHVDPQTKLCTDEHVVYYFSRDVVPDHHTVNHSKKEYVRREGDFKVTTNTVESFFAILKRGNYGIYHHWSRKYMAQYLREFDFRYNIRKLNDTDRAEVALRQTGGKRLMLKQPKKTVLS